MRRAVILAGGKGTRLKPYTISMPKPLVPIGGKPILERIILSLRDGGFTHITLTVNHFADMIMSYFEDGSKWGIKIDYSLERKPLSTMGPIRLIKDLPENFLVMNGDVITDLEFHSFYDKHISSSSLFTISSYRRQELIDFGVLELNSENKLLELREKPIYEFQVSMGVYMVSKQIVEQIPHDKFFGFDHLMEVLVSKKIPVNVVEHKGFWLDIGRPSDYEYANENCSKIFGECE